MSNRTTQRQTTTQNQQSRSSFDPYITDASRYAVNRGLAIADRPYEAYRGPRIAGISNNERHASSRAATGYNEGNELIRRSAEMDPTTRSGIQMLESGGALGPYTSDAARMITRGSRGFDEAWDAGALTKYLDAYANPMTEEANRDYAMAQNEAAARSALTGSFGGSRTGVTDATLAGRHMENLRDIRGQAFDRAATNFQQDQGRMVASGQALGALSDAASGRQLQAGGALVAAGQNEGLRQLSAGTTLGNMNAQQVRDLMTTGGVERVLEQAQLDFDYGQFLEARDWDVTNLAPLLSALSAVPKNVSNTSSGTSTTTSTQEGGELGMLVGAAATVAGAYFTGGASLLGGAGKTAAEAGKGASLQPINMAALPQAMAQPGSFTPASLQPVSSPYIGTRYAGALN